MYLSTEASRPSISDPTCEPVYTHPPSYGVKLQFVTSSRMEEITQMVSVTVVVSPELPPAADPPWYAPYAAYRPGPRQLPKPWMSKWRLVQQRPRDGIRQERGKMPCPPPSSG